MTLKPPKDDGEAIVLALRSPLRRQVLRATAEGRTTTSKLERQLGETMKKVSYHVRCLKFYGLIQVVDVRQVRGATQRIYLISDLGRRALDLAMQTGMLGDQEALQDGGSQELDR